MQSKLSFAVFLPRVAEDSICLGWHRTVSHQADYDFHRKIIIKLFTTRSKYVRFSLFYALCSVGACAQFKLSLTNFDHELRELHNKRHLVPSTSFLRSTSQTGLEHNTGIFRYSSTLSCRYITQYIPGNR